VKQAGHSYAAYFNPSDFKNKSLSLQIYQDIIAQLSDLFQAILNE
jgi:hypothetical protein